MPTYFVNKLNQKDGTHIVHSERCVFMPITKSLCIPLGVHNTCADAVVCASDFYENVRGCFVCLEAKNKELNTSNREMYEVEKAQNIFPW